MASLYEIDNEILSCIDLETGEILDSAKLDALQMERERKIEGVACWVKNLQAEAVAYKAEKEAFAEREKAANAKVERLKKWLADALGGEKFISNRCAVSFRRSERVEILDASVVPKKLLVKKISFDPDKAAIKEAIKAGKTVKGCALVANLNTSVK